MWARTRIASRNVSRCCRSIRANAPKAAPIRTLWPRRPAHSIAQAVIVSAIGLVRSAVHFRFEPIEDNTDYRRTGCLQLFLGPPYLVEFGASGTDNEKHRI